MIFTLLVTRLRYDAVVKLFVSTRLQSEEESPSRNASQVQGPNFISGIIFTVILLFCLKLANIF